MLLTNPNNFNDTHRIYAQQGRLVALRVPLGLLLGDRPHADSSGSPYRLILGHFLPVQDDLIGRKDLFLKGG
jgi:hypothetical protein